MSTSFSRPRITGFILGVTAVLCVSAQTAVPTTTLGVTTFTVSISEGPETFKYAEVVARLTTCVNGFSAGSDALKADCMRHLVSPDTSCSTVGSGIDSKFMCYVGSGTSRVLIDTDNIAFAFDGGDPADPSGGQLDGCVEALATAGFTPESKCYRSAACQASAGTVTSYGDFCPSATGEYCCSPTAARDTGYFPGTLLSAGADYLRAMDHISDMSFTIKYEVEAPARLRIVVDVPFVTASSKLEFTEDGVTKEYTMCPSTYMIDFVPPVETEPTGFVASLVAGERTGWLPLQHSAKQDLIGTPRSSCGNYDMTYGNEDDFVSKFLYPTSDPLASLAYGPTPAPDTAVWDISAGTDGIPNNADHFWKMGTPVTGRVNYTSGAGADGFFDLVKTHYQCQNSKTSTKVVTKITEPDPTYINGVPFPVETYEWTMSVCQVGFFGANCANTLESQLYGKTCAQIPASFSIGPQQIAHVAVSPVSADLTSKTFLESVRSITSNCDVGSERFAIALTLVVMDNDYSVMTESVHDVHEPLGIFEALSPVDIEMATADFDTVDAFLASNPAAEGVYKLKKTTVVFSGKTMHYHKIVMITQCYDTGIDSVKGTRGSPGVFVDAHATGDNVHVDLEILLQKTTDVTLQVTTNTLNLRILATKETFVLQSAFELTQKDVVAVQRLYGDYDQAKTDTAQTQFLPPATTMTGGDQICSKHQVQGVDAQVTNLVPNAVGACMLTASAEALTLADGVTTLAGTTISYTTPGMATPAKYTYGCFADWIDLSTPTDYAISEGVYIFVGQLTRLSASSTHESIFWFVQKQALEIEPLVGTNEPMHNRFGTGLFYYNSTGNAFVTEKSDQMQTLLGTDQFVPTKHDQAGCDTSAGNMKSACNLVCFDLAEGLLTDPDGLVEKQVLVHHVSVATVATEAESVPGNKFPAPAKHRRTLLESVATRTSPTGPSAQPSAASVEVRPGPMSAADTTAAAKRDTDGPIKHFDLALFIPVFVALPMIFLLIGCVAAHTRSNRLRKSTKGVSEPFLKNAF